MVADRKIIALDIGGVCCSIHPERLIARLNRAPTPDFLEKCRQVESSQITEDEFLDLFDVYTGRRFSRSGLIDLWNLCLGPSIPGMADAVRSVLKRGYSSPIFPTLRRFISASSSVATTSAIFPSAESSASRSEQ